MKYKDLSNVSAISLDIETYDPELTSKGPGVYRKDGSIVGVALATVDGWSQYFDFGHPGCNRQTRDRNKEYVRDMLATPIPKYGTNLLYDLDWLINGYGFEVNGEYNDIQVAEPLLDEYRFSYSLDSLAKDYLGKGKTNARLLEYCDRMGWKNKEYRKHIWEMPYEIVAEYACDDALDPLRIFEKQKTLLERQSLWELYRMEMDLFPLLLQMRKVGVPVEEKIVRHNIAELTDFITTEHAKLCSAYGTFNYNSSAQIATILDSLGISYPATEKGNPNLDKKVLKKLDHDFTNAVLDLRQADKVRGTFLINSFTHMNVAGRIHTQFHPLRTDDSGTVSGRFSSSHPNLQQAPNKDGKYGVMCRSCFVPETDQLWGKADYSQIEYRFIAHYAVGEGAEEIRKRYISDPHTDYHNLIMERAHLDRTRSKNLNFGAAFAMGAKSMSEFFGWDVAEAQEMLEHYNTMVPFMRTTRNYVVRVAKGRGYIKTILGRRARVSTYMRKERKEYIMFNRLIQGGAADLLKKGMLDSYNNGIFNVLTPYLTVHDELDFSVPRTKEGIEAYKELQYCMENAVVLKVPIKAECEIGPDWGHTEPIEDWGHIL